MPSDFLRIYVLWANGSGEGARLAELISRQFDGVGMERDGVAIRVPVRLRGEPWTPGGVLPRAIDLDGAHHNAIVLLHDGYMDEDADAWPGYVAALRAAMATRGGADIYIPFGNPDGPGQLAGDEDVQYARRDKWAALPDPLARDARFRLHLVFLLRRHLRRRAGLGDEGVPLFVSHAKADGDTAARAIIDYINRTDQDVPLRAFYDAKELAPGELFEARFEEEIERGTLLAIVSDVYDSRPWCVFELTTAKRARRPIVLADVGKVRTSRTFPYGANLPRIRITATEGETRWIDELLVETLAEGLRCDIFAAQATEAADAAGLADVLVLPRPPELFDLIEHAATTIIYPDPPLGQLEAELIGKATPTSTRLCTLSEVRPA